MNAWIINVGAEQTIHRVTQWPGQESQNQHGKIPTVVWYDTDNKVFIIYPYPEGKCDLSSLKAVSFGAEALSPQTEEKAEDNHWRMAKHFKLNLHPSDLTNKHKLRVRRRQFSHTEVSCMSDLKTLGFSALPTGVTISQIYADFLGYLLRHTQAYFEDHILDGPRIWKTYAPTLEVVIAHPNGWGIREQAFLRLAAVEAGFTKAVDADTKVHFVSEAEASVHFCMFHTNLGEQLKVSCVKILLVSGKSDCLSFSPE